MKITKEEFQRIDEKSPLELFHQRIKAGDPREYTRTLRQVLCSIFKNLFEGEFEGRVNQFVKLAKEDPDWTRNRLINLSIKLREPNFQKEIQSISIQVLLTIISNQSRNSLTCQVLWFHGIESMRHSQSKITF